VGPLVEARFDYSDSDMRLCRLLLLIDKENGFHVTDLLYQERALDPKRLQPSFVGGLICFIEPSDNMVGDKGELSLVLLNPFGLMRFKEAIVL
jgi:hypothetical protein